MQDRDFQITFRNSSDYDHLHQEIELLYVMEGKISLNLLGREYRLGEDDFIVINSNHRHRYIMQEVSTVCILHFDTEMIFSHVKKKEVFFHCNSSIEENEHYQYIRDVMAQLLSECATDLNMITFRKKSLAYDLLDHLNQFFTVDEISGISSGTEMRIEKMLQYINAHYMDSISLQELADHMYMAPSSVSRFFKKITGLNYLQYVNRIRLYYAREELCYTSEPITRIAETYGFANASAFCRIFKEEYGMTPAKYRVQFEDVRAEEHELPGEIKKGLGKYTEQGPVRSSSDRQKKLVQIQCNVFEAREWENPWTKSLHLGTAYELLSSVTRDQIMMAKKELGFTYGHIISIFSQKMLLRTGHERKITNFIYLDSVLDFVIKQGIIPVISFDNKKEVIMKDVKHIVYESQEEYPFETEEELVGVLEDFLLHIVRRYGIQEVSQWKFDCWYHTFKKMFMGLRTDDLVSVFAKISSRIKARIPEAKVGGWGLSFSEGEGDKVLADLIKQWSGSQILPDFVSLYLYPYMVVGDTDNKVEFKRRINNAEYYTGIVNRCRRLLDEYGMNEIPIYVSEWNTSMSKRNYYNETCGKAAHILQMISELKVTVEHAAYKELTDYSGIYEDKTDYLFGGWGLVNLHGAKKPSYYAFVFLNKAEKFLIYKDRYSIITTNGYGTYIILCFNAKRFRYSYYTKNEGDVLPTDAEQIFEDDRKTELTFCLDHVQNGYYSVREYRVYSGRGSVLYEWEKLGQNESMDEEDYEYLKNISVPENRHGHVRVSEGKLILRRELEKNEIRLIRLAL